MRLDRKFLRMAKEDRLHWLPDKLFLSCESRSAVAREVLKKLGITE